MVLCCICGVAVTGPCHGARCAHCLQKEIDITEGIGRRVHIHRCGTCGRYQKPPYVHCEPDSRELLGVCLRHVKGMGREHKLLDANFIWTEPHSKELKVKLVLQKEALAGVVVQQSMVVEYRVDDKQCPECQKSYTKHTWESCVQVRQRAEHRRTLLRLEQLIIDHRVHQQLMGLERTKDGVDFFFSRHNDALAFVAFIKAWAVVRHHDSKHLVSHNAANSTYRFKRTVYIELCSVCRDDLVHLPPKVAQSFGGLPSVMLCTRASAALTIIDPATMRVVEIPSAEFWKKPFSTVCAASHLKEFIVLDVTEDHGGEGGNGSCLRSRRSDGVGGASRGAIACEVEVARVADFGSNDDIIVVRSHLGGVLQVGDTVLGYDLRTSNAGLDDDMLRTLPLEVYLVRKKRPAKDPGQKPGRSSGPKTPAFAAPAGAAHLAHDGIGGDGLVNEHIPPQSTADGLPVAAEDSADVEEGMEGHKEDGEDEGDNDEEELTAAATQLLKSMGGGHVGGTPSSSADACEGGGAEDEVIARDATVAPEGDGEVDAAGGDAGTEASGSRSGDAPAVRGGGRAARRQQQKSHRRRSGQGSLHSTDTG